MSGEPSEWVSSTLGDITGLQDVLDAINDSIDGLISSIEPVLELLETILAALEIIIEILKLLGALVSGAMALIKQTLQLLKDELIQYLNDLLGRGFYMLPLFLYFPVDKLMREQLLNPLSQSISGQTSWTALLPSQTTSNPNSVRKVADPFLLGGTKVVRMDHPYSVRWDFNKFFNDITDSMNDSGDRLRPVFSDSVGVSGIVIALAAEDIFFLIRLIVFTYFFIGIDNDKIKDTIDWLYKVFNDIPAENRPGSAEDFLPPFMQLGETAVEWFVRLWEWLTSSIATGAEEADNPVLSIEKISDGSLGGNDISAWDLDMMLDEEATLGSLRQNYIVANLKCEGNTSHKGVFIRKFFDGNVYYDYSDTNDAGAKMLSIPTRDDAYLTVENGGYFKKKRIGANGPETVIEDNAEQQVLIIEYEDLTTDIASALDQVKDLPVSWIILERNVAGEIIRATLYTYDKDLGEWQEGKCNVFVAEAYDDRGLSVYTKYIIAFRYSLQNDLTGENVIQGSNIERDRAEDSSYVWNDNFQIRTSFELTQEPSAQFLNDIINFVDNIGNVSHYQNNDPADIYNEILPIKIPSGTDKENISMYTPLASGNVLSWIDGDKESPRWDLYVYVSGTFPTTSPDSSADGYLTVRTFLNGQELIALEEKVVGRQKVLRYPSELFIVPPALKNKSSSNVVEVVCEYQKVAIPKVKPYIITRSDGTKVEVYPYSADYFEQVELYRESGGNQGINPADSNLFNPVDVISLPVYSQTRTIKLNLGSEADVPIITSATRIAPSPSFGVGVQIMEGQGGPQFGDIGGDLRLLHDPTNKAGIPSIEYKPQAKYILQGLKGKDDAVVAYVKKKAGQPPDIWIYDGEGSRFSSADDDKIFFLEPGESVEFKVWAIPDRAGQVSGGQILEVKNNLLSSDSNDLGSAEFSPYNDNFVIHRVEVTESPEGLTPKAPNWASLSFKSFFDVITPIDAFLQSIIDQIPIPPNLLQPLIDWIEWMKIRIEWLRDKIQEIIDFLESLKQFLDFGGEGFYFLGINKAAGSNGFLQRFKNIEAPADLKNSRYVTGMVFLTPTDTGGEELLTIFSNLPSAPLPGEEGIKPYRFITDVEFFEQVREVTFETTQSIRRQTALVDPSNTHGVFDKEYVSDAKSMDD